MYLHINIFSVDYCVHTLYEFMVFIIIFEVDDLFEFVKQQHLRLMQFLAACAVIQNNNRLITVNLMC